VNTNFQVLQDFCNNVAGQLWTSVLASMPAGILPIRSARGQLVSGRLAVTCPGLVLSDPTRYQVSYCAGAVQSFTNMGILQVYDGGDGTLHVESSNHSDTGWVTVWWMATA
jgi:hypothetical protein